MGGSRPEDAPERGTPAEPGEVPLIWAILLLSSLAGAWLVLWRRSRFVRLPAPTRSTEERAHGADLLRVFPPIYVPLFGRPGEWVFAASKENPSVSAFDGPLGSTFWRALPEPAPGGWENRMLARMLASIDAFVPMDHVQAVRCPVLLVAAPHDANARRQAAFFARRLGAPAD